MSSATHPAAAPANVRAEIGALLEQAAHAYNAGDYETFVAAYHRSGETTMITYSPGDGPVQDRGQLVLRGDAEIRRMYAAAPMFKPGFDRPALSYELLHADLIAPDVAYVVAFAQVTGGDSRVPRQAVTSLVLRKANGTWQIIHDHTH
jgi:uncharacterized protein (TIGR02246 family)